MYKAGVLEISNFFASLSVISDFLIALNVFGAGNSLSVLMFSRQSYMLLSIP